MVAIIAAAGKGTRMASITGGRPKELLLLGTKTILDRVIDEAFEAGCREVVVVSSHDKPEIANALANRRSVRVAYQPTMRGVADAIACADVDDDSLIVMGDTVYRNGSPSKRMLQALASWDAAIAVETVPERIMGLYGICEVDNDRIVRIIEKPKPDVTASRFAVGARYALNRAMMQRLKDACQESKAQGEVGEIGLTPIVNEAIDAGIRLTAIPLIGSEERVDCGSPEEYREAMELAWD